MKEERLFRRVLEDPQEAGAVAVFAHFHSSPSSQGWGQWGCLASFPGGRRAVHGFRGKGRGPEQVTWRPHRSTLGGVVMQVTLFPSLLHARAGENSNGPPGSIMSGFMRAGPTGVGRPVLRSASAQI